MKMSEKLREALIPVRKHEKDKKRIVIIMPRLGYLTTVSVL
jgi:hypothetical protein